MSTQYGFYIDSSRCTGCKTCELACKDFKNLSPEVNFRRIYEYAGGDWTEQDGVYGQNVFAYYLSISCNHCDDPACAKVCPSGAMHKREDGFVVVDEEVCIGCRYCSMACPYGAPQFDEVKGHMTKCDGCYERVAEGKKPICVESCPLRALDLAPIEELRAKYGNLAEIAPLDDAETLTYLHGTISTKRHIIQPPHTPMYLDGILADTSLRGGLDPMLGDSHLRCLSILGFPGTTQPGLLDALNHLEFPYRWTTRFIALDKTRANKALSNLRRQWFNKRKSISQFLREVMHNEPVQLLDSDADNKMVDADAALQALGGDHVALQCDLSDGAGVDALVPSAVEALGGKLDILVNNAGVTRDNLAMRMKDEEWDQVIRVNLEAAFRLIRAAAKPMMKARYGRVVSITSVVGATGNPGQANYAASKAGLVGMSKALAQELAPVVGVVCAGRVVLPVADGTLWHRSISACISVGKFR